jgi:hypothetical protein
MRNIERQTRKKAKTGKKKMCRVSARRLSIYNFAWELLKATNLQAESKILKYWNIKSTNQNEKFSKKSMFGTLKV